MSIVMLSRTAAPTRPSPCFRDAESPPVHAGGLLFGLRAARDRS
jgi:hypothetical protein